METREQYGEGGFMTIEGEGPERGMGGVFIGSVKEPSDVGHGRAWREVEQVEEALRGDIRLFIAERGFEAKEQFGFGLTCGTEGAGGTDAGVGFVMVEEVATGQEGGGVVNDDEAQGTDGAETGGGIDRRAEAAFPLLVADAEGEDFGGTRFHGGERGGDGGEGAAAGIA